MEWGYGHSECPPEKWVNGFPIAEGKSQSPIDVKTGSVKFNNGLSSIMLDYKPETADNIVATGHSVQINFNSGSTIKGAHLANEYTLAQFHLHWGSELGSGSEHTIDGKSTEAEIHFVHWNSAKYKSIEEAVNNPDGLAVLGALIKQDDKRSNKNQANQIIKQFPKEWKIGEKNALQGPMDFESILPSTGNFYAYNGSLTTPPLNQCVKWILLRDPIFFSQEELDTFRKLPGKHSETLCNNFRPPQPLHDRTVETNFDLI
jgi:carbonic anhydrase 2